MLVKEYVGYVAYLLGLMGVIFLVNLNVGYSLRWAT